jgi:predicted metal-dependent enzyme (double-stranded beta helix superfamily)
MEFLPILEHADQIGANAWASLADTPEGKLVLVDNPFMKVLLIRWEPGALSSRHGHPAGSGMIKVLDGAVQEELFMDEISNAPYSAHVHHESATSYIDDTLGLHTIGNPFEEAAVTLHAYLKYR